MKDKLVSAECSINIDVSSLGRRATAGSNGLLLRKGENNANINTNAFSDAYNVLNARIVVSNYSNMTTFLLKTLEDKILCFSVYDRKDKLKHASLHGG
jgi:hypothetical protein